jgi:hypothetical protein
MEINGSLFLICISFTVANTMSIFNKEEEKENKEIF